MKKTKIFLVVVFSMFFVLNVATPVFCSNAIKTKGPEATLGTVGKVNDLVKVDENTVYLLTDKGYVPYKVDKVFDENGNEAYLAFIKNGDEKFVVELKDENTELGRKLFFEQTSEETTKSQIFFNSDKIETEEKISGSKLIENSYVVADDSSSESLNLTVPDTAITNATREIINKRGFLKIEANVSKADGSSEKATFIVSTDKLSPTERNMVEKPLSGAKYDIKIELNSEIQVDKLGDFYVISEDSIKNISVESTPLTRDTFEQSKNKVTTENNWMLSESSINAFGTENKVSESLSNNNNDNNNEAASEVKNNVPETSASNTTTPEVKNNTPEIPKNNSTTKAISKNIYKTKFGTLNLVGLTNKQIKQIKATFEKGGKNKAAFNNAKKLLTSYKKANKIWACFGKGAAGYTSFNVKYNSKTKSYDITAKGKNGYMLKISVSAVKYKNAAKKADEIGNLILDANTQAELQKGLKNFPVTVMKNGKKIKEKKEKELELIF